MAKKKKVLKTKLLSLVRKLVTLKKEKIYGFELYSLEVDSQHLELPSKMLFDNLNTAKSMTREVRLDLAYKLSKKQRKEKNNNIIV